MTSRPFCRRVLRRAGAAFTTALLAALPALLLQAAPSAPADPTAPAAPVTHPGTIAYVKRSTQDIHLISPDGTNDRVLWTAPDSENLTYDLAWRPDGGELAFSSEHEYQCSYYQSDLYGIGADGTGYRRITNAPACAALAGLPKGTVTLNVTNGAGQFAWVYVAGAPGIQTAASGTMTFNNVADFGAGIGQPAIGIYVDPYYGEERTQSTGTPADVQPGQTVAGGTLNLYGGSGQLSFGTGEVSWTADGAALAYVMRTRAEIRQLPATPAYGAVGDPLPLVADTRVTLVDWGPTTATQNQYLYVAAYNWAQEGLEGIYLNTVGDPSGGEMLVDIDGYYRSQEVWDVEWLPDGSGFLFSLFDVYLGYYGNLYKYDFTTEQVSQLTDLPVDVDFARGLSIAPDGQAVVFERTDQIDTEGNLWILDLNTTAINKLADDAARPAWGPGASPAVAPEVHISLSGTNIGLGWEDIAANTGGYKVRYSEEPYFQPTDAGVTTVSLGQGAESWTHTNGAGNAERNYCYLVQGVNAGGSVSAPSNRTGGFNFGLTRGSQ